MALYHFQNELNKLKKEAKNLSCKKIKLINGDVLEGTIQEVGGDVFSIKRPDNGAGQATYTVPFSAVLYISDCELD